MRKESKRDKEFVASLLLGRDNITLACREYASDSCCQFVGRKHFDSQKELTAVIKNLMVEAQLPIKTPCYAILRPNEYRMITMDKPDIAAKDIQKNLPALASEQLQLSADVMLFNYFNLPYANSKTNQDQMSVVAINKELAYKLKKSCKSNKLLLKTLTISEMAYLSLLHFICPNDSSMIMFQLLDNTAEMMIVYNGEMAVSSVLPKPPEEQTEEFTKSFLMGVKQLYFKFQQHNADVNIENFPLIFPYFTDECAHIEPYLSSCLKNPVKSVDLRETFIGIKGKPIDDEMASAFNLALFGGLMNET